MSQPIAIIDLGSNSARMLIAKLESNHLTVIDEHKEQLGLASFVEGDETGKNKEVVHELICSCLKRMISIANPYQPCYRLLATYAIRQMTYYSEIVNRIYGEFGLHLEVIDGIEEGRLAAIGMEQGLELDGSLFLGVDVGGGSTEIVLRENSETLFGASISCGALNLTSAYLGYDSYDPKQYRVLHQEVNRSLVPVIHDLQKKLEGRNPLAVISSGTGKAIANIYGQIAKLKQSSDDIHGVTVPGTGVSDVCRKLLRCGSPFAINDEFELSSTRSKIILAGASIIDGIGKLLNIQEWKASSYGLREGAVFDTVLRISSASPYQVGKIEKIKLFANQCKVDTEHASRVAELSVRILEQLKEIDSEKFELKLFENPDELIHTAGLLHECGRFIAYPKFHRHSYYMIFNARLPGLNQKQRQWVALIARHHRKSICKPNKLETADLTSREISGINLMAGILRLVSSLYRTREDSVTSLGIEKTKEGLHFKVHFAPDHHSEVCLLQAQLEVPSLKKSFGCDVKISCTNQELVAS